MTLTTTIALCVVVGSPMLGFLSAVVGWELARRIRHLRTPSTPTLCTRLRQNDARLAQIVGRLIRAVSTAWPRGLEAGGIRVDAAGVWARATRWGQRVGVQLGSILRAYVAELEDPELDEESLARTRMVMLLELAQLVCALQNALHTNVHPDLQATLDALRGYADEQGWHAAIARVGDDFNPALHQEVNGVVQPGAMRSVIRVHGIYLEASFVGGGRRIVRARVELNTDEDGQNEVSE